MAVRSPASSRRIVAVVLTVVLVPSVLLVVLGWRLFEQDRASALKQLDDRRRQTADLVVARLEQAVAASEQSLRDERSRRELASHDDAAVVVVEKGRMTVTSGRVAFLPQPAPGAEIPAARFSSADELNRHGD